MNEATFTVAPSETTIVEDVHNIIDDTRSFVHRNRDVLLVIGAVGISMFIIRGILRKELKRLSFNVEVFPFDQFDSDEYAAYTND